MKTLFTLAALLPLPALAHPGDHSGVTPAHVMGSADHLAVLIAVIAVAGLAASIRARR